MPDHVHLLISPLEIQIGEIMRRVKGGSARAINAAVGTFGTVWQREYFDRELRRSEDIRSKGEYIVLNPVRAGLVDAADAYEWICGRGSKVVTTGDDRAPTKWSTGFSRSRYRLKPVLRYRLKRVLR